MTKQWHPDELALLAAIHAEPRDDTPRLVYTDWLQEHDQPEYAEFIRWQVASGLLVRYSVSRKHPAVHSVVTSSRISPELVDRDRLPPTSRVPDSVLARLRPFPRRAMLGAPHVSFDRGLPVVRISGSTGSARGFDDLLPAFCPSVRFHDLGIMLDNLADPLTSVLESPVLRRADSLRLSGVHKPEQVEEFVSAAREVLPRLLSIQVRTLSEEVTTRLSDLLNPICPVIHRHLDPWNNWFTYWLRER